MTRGIIHALVQVFGLTLDFSFVPGPYKGIVAVIWGALGAIIAYLDQTLSKPAQ